MHSITQNNVLFRTYFLLACFHLITMQMYVRARAHTQNCMPTLWTEIPPALKTKECLVIQIFTFLKYFALLINIKSHISDILKCE